MKKRSIYILVISGLFAIFLLVCLVVFYPVTAQHDNATTAQSNNASPIQSVAPIPASLSLKANVWLAIAVFVLSLATIISVGISFYLYRWRKMLFNQTNELVPEEWGKYLKNVGNSVTDLNDSQTSAIQNLIKSSQGNSEKIQNMIETYMALQKTLDAKDKEIIRLKKGYDTSIIKKFLYRFIRIDQTVHEFIEYKEFGSEQMEQLSRLFEDALEECCVEEFLPAIGDDIRKADGVADNPKKIVTEVADDDYKIAGIVSAGYRIMSGDQFDYLVPAKVKVFTYKNEEKK